MAYMIKNRAPGSVTSASHQGYSVLGQYTHVATAARTIPASTTDIIFRVYGGRCLVHLLVGEVTTIIQAQATTLKVSSKKLDAVPAAVGTAVDICATVDGNAKEVGSLYVPLGSGAAAVWSNAGAALGTLGRIPFIVPQGEIYLTTVATSTGAMKWDIWYQPLDEGAYIVSQGVAAVVI